MYTANPVWMLQPMIAETVKALATGAVAQLAQTVGTLNF